MPLHNSNHIELHHLVVRLLSVGSLPFHLKEIAQPCHARQPGHPVSYEDGHEPN